MARPALGFVAKVVCSDVFVGGVSPDRTLDDIPDEPIARLVRTRVDTVAGRVTASIPLVAKRTAVWRDGSGCTLEPLHDLPHVRTATPPADEDASWPEATNGDAIDRTTLDAALDTAFAEPDPATPRGTRAVVVVHRGRIIAERYADGYDTRTRFPGWSMTKSVTNALVGILISDGMLALSDAALRPEWREPGDPRAQITLQQILHMSSGLAFDESYTPTGGATRMLFDAENAAAVATAAPPAHAPGSYWSYSSGTTNIISALIRDVIDSDSAYAALPYDALFDRIGMTSAVLEVDPSGTFVGSSFMYATARDWARFGLLFLRDGVWQGERILPEGWVEFSTTPAPTAPLGQYGAHWWLNAGAANDMTQRTWPDLPRDIFYASGFQGQYVVVIPSHDLVIVRLGLTPDDRAFDLGMLLKDVIRAVNGAGQT